MTHVIEACSATHHFDGFHLEEIRFSWLHQGGEVDNYILVTLSIMLYNVIYKTECI